MVDYDKLKSKVHLSSIVGQKVSLIDKGGEKVGRCPSATHEDKTPSFNVNDYLGKYYCHGCGIYGDHIDFLCDYLGMTDDQAKAYLADLSGSSNHTIKLRTVAMKKFKQITPVPVGKEDPGTKMQHYKYGVPTTIWPYKNTLGNLLFYIRRWDIDGGKKIAPLSYGNLNGDVGWHERLAIDPRPLYGLEELSRKLDANILIVEGEKAADVAKRLFPSAVCMTWPGGTSSAKKVDCSPLKGRNVFIWPDNDNPGFKAAAVLRDKLLDISIEPVIIRPPEFMEEGEDVADFKGTLEEAKELIIKLIAEVKESPWDPLSEIENQDSAAQPGLTASKQLLATSGQLSDSKELTEDDAAYEFVSSCGGKIQYCHSKGKWFKWNDIYWEQDNTGFVFESVRYFCREKKFAGRNKYGTLSLIRNIENFSKTDLRVAAKSDKWDADIWALGTPAGIVDLRTGVLIGPQKEAYNTKITSIAPADTANCPVFLKFLNEATNGDIALHKYLQQLAGYCLTGETREHSMAFVYGDGGNGKSVFLNVLSDILAEYSVTAPMTTFTNNHNEGHPTEIAMLNGSRLVSVSETEAGKKLAEAKIKRMTGGDVLTGRYMRQDFFEFMPQFKVIMVGNHQPELEHVDEAMRRRLNIIPFIHKPVIPDKNLPEKLKVEYPAILRWAIDGCLSWQKEGFIIPDVVTKATETYFSEQDVFHHWIEENCTLGACEWEASAKLFQSWEIYQKRNGEHPGNSKSFGQLLKKHGFKDDRRTIMGKRDRGFEGIRLNYNPKSAGISHD